VLRFENFNGVGELSNRRGNVNCEEGVDDLEGDIYYVMLRVARVEHGLRALYSSRC
jgi:hypothetical protein